MPPIDESQFKLWVAAAPRSDNGVRYSFLTYTRPAPGESGAPSLPPAVAARHEEMQVGGWVILILLSLSLWEEVPAHAAGLG